MNHSRRRRLTGVAALLALAATGVAACSSSSADSSPTAPGGSDSMMISADRCQQNKSAGTITFLTSFQYAASPGILDIVTADQAGYFKDLCLNVKIQPGSTNAQLVSAGTAQIAGVGGPSDAITAAAAGGNVVGIATYGNTSAMELLTRDDGKINSLRDLEGKTLGYKGAMPPQVQAMLLKAGVDTSKIKEVSVGYDPTILPQGKVDALTAYKSNEAQVLPAKGYKIKEWDPESFGIKSAFNSLIANKPWAQGHPTAVEDFLRAAFEGFAYASAHLDEALGWAAKRSTAGYDIPSSKLRWQTESKLVDSTLISGHGVGWQTVQQWTPEYQYLQQFKLISKPVDLSSLVDNDFVNAIYHGSTLMWPAKPAPAPSSSR